ncbi:collagen alpha-1(I) chain-like [Pongo pygmaeus]|uniref:collagen alpha-1(I) chain-like n=1 Tax=Pongo pygmaeus TaxID=9600 RepID=UPI00300C6793
MAAEMGRPAAAPREPNALLPGPAAAALAASAPTPTRLRSPGAACRGERGPEASRGARGRPRPLCGAPRRAPGAAGPVLPAGGAETSGRGRRSPPPPASPDRGEAGRARPSSLGFCFPPGMTGPAPPPVSGPRLFPDRQPDPQPAPLRAGAKLRFRVRAPGRRGRGADSPTWRGCEGDGGGVAALRVWTGGPRLHLPPRDKRWGTASPLSAACGGVRAAPSNRNHQET